MKIKGNVHLKVVKMLASVKNLPNFIIDITMTQYLPVNRINVSLGKNKALKAH